MNYMNKSLLNSVGLSYGELSLKGKNRGQFERMLRNRIHKSLNGYNHQLVDDLSKLYVMVDNNDMDEVIEKLKKIFGVVGLNPSARIGSEDEEIKAKVLEVANYAYEQGARTFKIAVNRSNKGFEKKSMDYARELGAHVLINSSFEKVQMKDPDVQINVDIRKNVYVYTERIKTYGGLPIGSTGKGLVLLSGGIDSPVASFMMAKRGMRINFVTFNSFPFTSKLYIFCNLCRCLLLTSLPYESQYIFTYRSYLRIGIFRYDSIEARFHSIFKSELGCRQSIEESKLRQVFGHREVLVHRGIIVSDFL